MEKTIYSLTTIVEFGKYRKQDLTVREIIDKEPAYIEWCVNNIEWFKLDEKADNYLDDMLEVTQWDAIDDITEDEDWGRD